MKRLLTLLACTLLAIGSLWADQQPRREARRLIDKGNTAYNEKRYADAEAIYTKAIQADPANKNAVFNLAMALLRQATPGQEGQKLMQRSQQLMAELAADVNGNPAMAATAAYNLGNMAFNLQQWDQAIDWYKKSLRINPDDDRTRQNLRLAQLKKKENQNKDQNKDQDKGKDQDKQQDQEKDQNKDQNKDQQQPPQNQDKKDQPQQPQQPQGGISDENAEKILQAMENEEAATRRRIEANRQKAANASRRQVAKPW